MLQLDASAGCFYPSERVLVRHPEPRSRRRRPVRPCPLHSFPIELADTLGRNTVITDYPDIRDLLCLQASSNQSYCVTDTLTNIQTANGSDITVSSVERILGGGFGPFLASLNNLPSSAYCTDCGHAIITVAGRIANNATGSSSATGSASSAISSKCGSAFVCVTFPLPSLPLSSADLVAQ